VSVQHGSPHAAEERETRGHQAAMQHRAELDDAKRPCGEVTAPEEGFTAKGEGRGHELRASEAERHDDARDSMPCNDLAPVASERLRRVRELGGVLAEDNERDDVLGNEKVA